MWVKADNMSEDDGVGSIGRALAKVRSGGAQSSGALVDSSRYDNTIGQRRFEYEDGIIARSVEASEQILRMAQPFVFSKKELDQQHIIHQEDKNSSVYSLLKDLRNRITLQRQGMGATVLVTSVSESLQSSLFAKNLAAIISADESRTSLLLETHSTESRLYGDLDAVTGLCDFISEGITRVEDVIYPTGVARMRVIPFGNSDFSDYEYLRTTRMRILIKDIIRRYPRERYTIIDAPAVDEVSDVELLNEYVDFIVVCVPYGEVSASQLNKGLEKLDKNKLLGVVLTGSPRIPRFFPKFMK
jgi:Mrp family chromosome partitioning ATPase